MLNSFAANQIDHFVGILIQYASTNKRSAFSKDGFVIDWRRDVQVRILLSCLHIYIVTIICLDFIDEGGVGVIVVLY
ncbi:hypothetical protein D3C75_519720 [compost metagenome]